MNGNNLRKGWCPGALRPMETGDGLLVRVRPSGGIVSSATARVLADCADAYGNGLLDLSNRANIQIRGVSGDTFPMLIERLQSAGLVDDDEMTESVRNIMMAPLGGVDPTALIDPRGLVSELEHRLKNFVHASDIPSKFGFSIDDGGAFSLWSQGADIRLEAVSDGGTGKPAIAIGINGSERIVVVPLETAVEVAIRFVDAFLLLSLKRSEPIRRMVQLVGHLGDETIFEAAGFALERLRPHVARTTPVKLDFQSCDEMKYLALGVPFGRLTSRMMRTLAGLADLNGSGELRMTPWRSVLLPGIAAGDHDKVFAQLGGEFIVDVDDPLLRVASCPGSPACKNGSTRTQDDARALALLAKNLTMSGTGLHVSGCRKGCARAAASDVTLVGRDGRYDVVLSGRAGDDPSQYGLTFEQVREYLGTMNAAKDGACEKVAL